MKKLLKTIMLIFISISILTNVTFATDYTTSYCPAKIDSGKYIVDAWAKQPEGAPWCLIVCMKIVLNDIMNKLGEASSPPLSDPYHIDRPKITAMLKDNKTEIAMLHKLFLKKLAITAKNNLHNSSSSQQSKFKIAMQRLSDMFLDTNIKTRVSRLSVNEFGLLYNGLINLANPGDLSALWSGLEDEAKQMLVQKSDTDLLGTMATELNLPYISTDVVEGFDYFSHISSEIKNKRMVIVIFRNPTNHTERHACVAYKVNEIGFFGNNIYVFNPWGNDIVISDFPSRYFNLNNGTSKPEMNWEIDSYITFNY